MDEKHRVSGFRALLKSHQTDSIHLADKDGDYRLWRDLSDEGKLESIVRDAAFFDVPFEPFAEAVRESIDSSAIGDAALRLAMRSVRELHELESLYPDDGRTEPPPPLVEWVRELVNAEMAEQENDEVLSCEKLAAIFKEMRADEAAAKREDAHWYGSQKRLDEKAQPPAQKDKARDIER